MAGFKLVFTNIFGDLNLNNLKIKNSYQPTYQNCKRFVPTESLLHESY